jgi:hypothetical protein
MPVHHSLPLLGFLTSSLLPPLISFPPVTTEYIPPLPQDDGLEILNTMGMEGNRYLYYIKLFIEKIVSTRFIRSIAAL